MSEQPVPTNNPQNSVYMLLHIKQCTDLQIGKSEAKIMVYPSAPQAPKGAWVSPVNFFTTIFNFTQVLTQCKFYNNKHHH